MLLKDVCKNLNGLNKVISAHALIESKYTRNKLTLWGRAKYIYVRFRINKVVDLHIPVDQLQLMILAQMS
jgi:hypothetical protein